MIKREGISCRYLQYVLDWAVGGIDRPHFAEVTLKSVHFSPIPLFNRQRSVQRASQSGKNDFSPGFRTGCRPFLEIFDDEQKKIFSTFQEANKIP